MVIAAPKQIAGCKGKGLTFSLCMLKKYCAFPPRPIRHKKKVPRTSARNSLKY
jgi:hypothetical protein